MTSRLKEYGVLLSEKNSDEAKELDIKCILLHKMHDLCLQFMQKKLRQR